MRGIVWGATLERAKNKLQEIIEDYRRMNYTIDLYRDSKYELRVQFNNGDYWVAKHASEACRALRSNIGYIDYQIDNEIVDCVLKPTLTLPPYHATQYFG